MVVSQECVALSFYKRILMHNVQVGKYIPTIITQIAMGKLSKTN